MLKVGPEDKQHHITWGFIRNGESQVSPQTAEADCTENPR